MRQLLSNGAKVNERGENDATALLVACEARNMELIKVLLENGADRTYKARGLCTAVRFRIRAGISQPTLADSVGAV